MRTFLVCAAAIVCLAAIEVCVGAQTTGSSNPPLVIHSVSGEDLFKFYCSSCHGRDGAGDGPVAAALDAAPPDLRQLSLRNGGTFPRQRVRMLVGNDGSLRAGHGPIEMPVWGPVFKGLDASEAMATVRIANIVEYLEGIQAK